MISLFWLDPIIFLTLWIAEKLKRRSEILCTPPRKLAYVFRGMEKMLSVLKGTPEFWFACIILAWAYSSNFYLFSAAAYNIHLRFDTHLNSIRFDWDGWWNEWMLSVACEEGWDWALSRSINALYIEHFGQYWFIAFDVCPVETYVGFLHAAIHKYFSIRKYVCCVCATYFCSFSFFASLTDNSCLVCKWMNQKTKHENVNWCDRPQANPYKLCLNEVLLQAYLYACLIFGRRTEICVTPDRAQTERERKKNIETEHCCIGQQSNWYISYDRLARRDFFFIKSNDFHSL